MQIMREMCLWQNKCKYMNISTNIAQFFCECENVVSTYLKILITLSLTTASSERSFSTLKRLKTYLRYTTGQLIVEDLFNLLKISYWI